MPDFIMIPSKYDEIPAFITANLAGLVASPSYQRLSDDERRVPGLVCAALTRFMVELEERAAEEGLTNAEAKTLDETYRVLESLASSTETRIQNVVVTEVLENIRTRDSILQVIISRFGPSTRSLYDRWVK